VTLALGTRLASSGSGGNVTPIDPPVERRALVTDQLSEPLVLEFDTIAVDFLVASDGTYDVISLEGGILPINVLTEASDKFILTVN
jgi:hypothetical protein